MRHVLNASVVLFLVLTVPVLTTEKLDGFSNVVNFLCIHHRISEPRQGLSHRTSTPRYDVEGQTNTGNKGWR